MPDTQPTTDETETNANELAEATRIIAILVRNLGGAVTISPRALTEPPLTLTTEMRPDTGLMLRIQETDVEILERADDPSHDEVGTTAELDGVVWVKTEPTVWRQVGGDMRIGNPGMRDRTVTGAVLGTPAAEAQEAQRRANDPLLNIPEEWKPKPKPLVVVQYGDPEPTDHSKKFTTPQNATVEMGTFGWRVIESNGDATINIPWSSIPTAYFPITEVVVEP